MAREYCTEECRLSRKRRLRGLGIKPICEKCGDEFERNSSRQKFCVPCRDGARKEYNSQYYVDNAEIIKPLKREDASAFRAANPKLVRERDRAWKAANWDDILAARKTPEEREKSRRRYAARYKKDVRVGLNARMSVGVYQSLVGNKHGRKWETLVGYTLSELMNHLERQFLPGMTWENRGDWHIDHIVPLSSFNFTSFDDDGFKAAWAITNLRPLWAHDNMSKGAKVLTFV